MRKTIVITCLLISLLTGFALAMGKVPSQQSASLDFALNDLAGKVYTLSDYKGKVVFLNFWATWCPPCRAEMPSMQKLYERWDKDKYVMLAVNSGQGGQEVKSFADKNGYTFTILLDEDGKVSQQYGIQGIPTTFIINAKGEIVSKLVGSREWSEKEIKSLLDGRLLQ